MIHNHMTLARSYASTLVAIASLALGACTPWNKVTRPSKERATAPTGSSNCIEGTSSIGAKYGCSFVEFDGKGGFLDYGQFADAKKNIEQLGREGPVLLVFFCHGWHNSAHSGNVVAFNTFLRQLAESSHIRAQGMRVQGVYLSWRASRFLPSLSKEQQAKDAELAREFGGESLVDAKWNQPAVTRPLVKVPELLTYWAMRNRADQHVSAVPIAKTVFGLSSALKSTGTARHRTFAIGHSFGALVLEKSLGLASVSLISAGVADKAAAKFWPLDLIVFMNSAAPSLYAKQLGEFLQDERKVSAAPRIVSVTSTGDKATGMLHPFANTLKRLPFVAPDLQREYHPDGSKKPGVKAWEYFGRTPGHNPKLINRKVIPAELPAKAAGYGPDAVFEYNLKESPPFQFLTKRDAGDPVRSWYIDLLEKGYNGNAYPTNYWIVTVPPEIIADHGDVFSASAMQTLGGIFRSAEFLRKLPAERSKRHQQRD